MCLDTPSEELLSYREKYRIIDFNKAIKDESLEGRQVESPPPQLDTVFTLSYTSGTTGEAKGALLRHKNMIPSLASSHLLEGEVDASI